MRRRIRLAALVGMLPAVALAAPPLPGVGADGRGVTVSGISSGGYMAVQFQVVYSKRVRGAGIIAAGPYDCAQGSSIRALKHCMSPTWWASPPGPAEVKARMEPRARLGLIDPPASLADDRVWMLGGAADTTVEPPVMDALEAFYRQWVPAGAIRRVRLPEAGHAMISVADGKANACGTSEPPYINRCGDFDAAGELLRHLLGPLEPRRAPDAGALLTFDQRPFIDGPPADISMAEQGFVYLPAACRAGGCRVHVAFHGCRQGEDQIGRRFVEGAGYNPWAEANRLIVLYPQTVARTGWVAGSYRWILNPKGCWDWWGYSSADYATRNGPQLEAVRRMVDRLQQPAR